MDKNNTNQNRANQLGMPWGTAMNRLRKIILFSLLEKHNENNCFRCSAPILVIDELSIEHKKPWLYISSDLFWNLDNIAFSHLKCNKPDRPRYPNNEHLRKVGPEGTSWCVRHQAFLPKEQFSKDLARWNGLVNRCKECDHYWRNRSGVAKW